MKKQILLTVGPVNVSKKVRNALLCPDMVHREKEFYDLLTEVRKKLVKVAGGNEEYTSVIFTGSGTASIEAVISSIHGKLFLIINGSYGKRMEEMAKRYGIKKTSLDFCFDYLDLEKIEKVLKDDKDITHIAVVHNETTTGMLNPLNEIGMLAKKYKKSLIVDAVSSLGGHKLSVINDNIDFCISSPNKCLQGLPGISFVITKKSILEDLKNKKPRNVYLDLYDQYKGEEGEEIPFTFAIQVLFALNAALDEFFEEGLENRIMRYKTLAKTLRNGLEELGFKLLLPRHQMSNVVTTVILPKRISYEDLHDKLKERGFIVYEGKSKFSGKAFRLGNMGALTQQDIHNFLSAIKEILNELNISIVK